MNDLENQAILILSCPDQRGIVAAVSGYLTDCGCNITESAQFDDLDTGLFFMRVQFDLGTATLGEIRTGFSPIARRFAMRAWDLKDATHAIRALILVSKTDHCLVDLLHRERMGTLRMDVRAIVSNHETTRPFADMYGKAFHHLPIGPEGKDAQEQALLRLIDQEAAELVILARYMQILSPRLVSALGTKAINIHHSFLPSFKGAKPYHRAYERGVKLIGATAHFVTEALDEGPIIDQDVARVDHTMTPKKLIEMGRDIERRVLARAVQDVIEHRVLINGVKTVVFR
ncbi:MAG: formyltetrahydrofolate deformylase [Pseudomonadota bacterium]